MEVDIVNTERGDIEVVITDQCVHQQFGRGAVDDRSVRVSLPLAGSGRAGNERGDSVEDDTQVGAHEGLPFEKVARSPGDAR